MLPTAGRPGNKVRRTSSPITMTGRFCESSMFVDPAAFIDRQVANLVELRRNAQDLSAGLEEIAHRADVVRAEISGAAAATLGHSVEMS